MGALVPCGCWNIHPCKKAWNGPMNACNPALKARKQRISEVCCLSRKLQVQREREEQSKEKEDTWSSPLSSAWALVYTFASPFPTSHKHMKTYTVEINSQVHSYIVLEAKNLVCIPGLKPECPQSTILCLLQFLWPPAFFDCWCHYSYKRHLRGHKASF